MEKQTLLIPYFRVSSKKQGRSGLGLKAQQTAYEKYREEVGGTTVMAYPEVETGTDKRHRPILEKAIAHCKLTGATLVIAKLDRLWRSVFFTAMLMESGVEFICCDMPGATNLTIHIHAAVAEDEAKRISERTIAALKEAKKEGVKLGSSRPGHWTGREAQRREGGRQGAKVAAKNRAKIARDVYDFLVPEITEMKHRGMTLKQIAQQLNNDGYTTREHKPFRECTIWRILKRLETVKAA